MVHWLRRYESEAYKIRFDSGDKGISDSTLDLRAGMVGRVKRPLLSLGDLVQRKNTSSATKRRGIGTPNLHLRNHQQTMTTDKIYEARSFSLVLFFFFFFFFCLLSVLCSVQLVKLILGVLGFQEVQLETCINSKFQLFS